MATSSPPKKYDLERKDVEKLQIYYNIPGEPDTFLRNVLDDNVQCAVASCSNSPYVDKKKPYNVGKHASRFVCPEHFLQIKGPEKFKEIALPISDPWKPYSGPGSFQSKMKRKDSNEELLEKYNENGVIPKVYASYEDYVGAWDVGTDVKAYFNNYILSVQECGFGCEQGGKNLCFRVIKKNEKNGDEEVKWACLGKDHAKAAFDWCGLGNARKDGKSGANGD